jgi:alpha-glucosidase (family GH31 glycosyl hydrolase)
MYPCACTHTQFAVAFSCCCRSFLFKDQFIELTTSVPQDSDLYGVGETTLPTGLLLPRDGNVITMWARDSASAEAEINIYGAHPFYLQLNKGAGVAWFEGLGWGVDC